MWSLGSLLSDIKLRYSQYIGPFIFLELAMSRSLRVRSVRWYTLSVSSSFFEKRAAFLYFEQKYAIRVNVNPQISINKFLYISQ